MEIGLENDSENFLEQWILLVLALKDNGRVLVW